MNIRLCALFLLCSLVSKVSFTAAGQQVKRPKVDSRPTLSSLQTQYLGKSVVIQEIGSQTWEGAEVHTGDIAVVNSVSLHDAMPTERARPNVFGETKVDNSLRDPYVDITVTLPNGEESHTTGYARNFCCERDRFQIKYVAFRVTTPKELRQRLIQKSLPTVIGKNLYALRESILYDASSTRDQLLEHHAARIEIKDEDLYLKPLHVTKAVYDEPSDHIFLKLGLPDGKSAIAVTPYVEEGPGAPFLEKIEGTLFSAPPGCFSQLDIRALRSKTLYRGVSDTVVNELYGSPERENDWGSGGTQRVYYHGALMVYLNGNDKVTNWQFLDE